MVGTTPLTRSLPDKDEDTNEFLVTKDEDGVAEEPEYVEVDSETNMPDSGIILSMFSSSLTTSNIDGRLSVSSWQQLRAKATNLSTHSDG